MSLFQEIRKQSRTTREALFGLSVFTTILVVSALWFHSFQSNMYALLNPGQDPNQDTYAQETDKQNVFARGFSGLKAGIYSVLNINQEEEINSVDHSSGKVYLLPLSGNKND